MTMTSTRSTLIGHRPDEQDRQHFDHRLGGLGGDQPFGDGHANGGHDELAVVLQRLAPFERYRVVWVAGQAVELKSLWTPTGLSSRWNFLSAALSARC